MQIDPNNVSWLKITRSSANHGYLIFDDQAAYAPGGTAGDWTDALKDTLAMR